VRLGRLRVLGLLFPVLAATACTDAEATSTARRTDVAVHSYAAPDGAPGYCTLLAGSLHVTLLASAVGTRTARPGDVEAKLDLGAAAEELTAVRNEVDPDGPLTDALDGLLAALSQARSGPLTETLRTEISTGLDDVGRLVQPDCDFPA
jgi:hypothetical protein